MRAKDAANNPDIPLKRPKNVSETSWDMAKAVYNAAVKAGDKFPELTVAQAALETGWFKHVPASYNFFGQKASKSEKGTVAKTKEAGKSGYYATSAKWKSYSSLDEALHDRVNKWGSKYSNASNLSEALYSIWQYDEKRGTGRGYATAPDYDKKVGSILSMMGSSMQVKPHEGGASVSSGEEIEPIMSSHFEIYSGDFNPVYSQFTYDLEKEAVIEAKTEESEARQEIQQKIQEKRDFLQAFAEAQQSPEEQVNRSQQFDDPTLYNYQPVDVQTANLDMFSTGQGLQGFQNGGTLYTLKGSDAVYRKTGDTWEVDWNRSGNFLPLSKGDVKERVSNLNKNAKPLYDRDYVGNFSWESLPSTKSPSKPVTEDKRKAQQAFNNDFKVTEKPEYDKIEEEIYNEQQKYIKQAAEMGVEVNQNELNQISERIWGTRGNVWPKITQDSIQAYTPEKPQGLVDKTFDIMGNPMTAAGFLVRGQAIPDYMQRDMDRGTFGYWSNGVFHTERNPLDMAVADITPLGLIRDARDVYSGASSGDYMQAGAGLASFIPGVGEARKLGAVQDVNKAINFSGPAKFSYQDAPEVLQALRQRGRYWDEAGANGEELLHPDLVNYHGTYDGRPIVEVKMPDGSSEYFYKSSGWAKKEGEGVGGTTEGMWQIYGGHADHPLATNWFVKGDDYKDYYGSNTYRSMANTMDNILMKKYGFNSMTELENAFNFKNRFGAVDSFVP